MSPPLSETASHLSDCQLFHQVALILEAMSAGRSNRRGALPLKLPRSQPVGPQKLVFFLRRLVFLLSHMDPWEIPQVQMLAITSKILTRTSWSTLASSLGYS